MYVFPKINLKKFNIESDEQFTYDLLNEHHVLVVPGSGFNTFDKSHFRVVFLPNADMLNKAIGEIENMLEERRLPVPALI
jgi:alanine-synthesizing transaminase